MGDFQKKMAKLKPELDDLKQRYKNNPRKFQESQMKLMREHKAQPPLLDASSRCCRSPIFFGLFQVLGTAIELRHSEFILWVKDLSQPDALPLPFSLPLIGNTLNVLPILMMITWFLQTLMTPKPSDPQQAQMMKMMSIMPFVMAFFLYNYAAGAVALHGGVVAARHVPDQVPARHHAHRGVTRAPWPRSTRSSHSLPRRARPSARWCGCRGPRRSRSPAR
jgi:YidC/Oxa1 family membrane protein insertase